MAELRAFVYLDRLQPQFTAYLGANMRGYLPVVGMAATVIEIAPGLAINQVADAALKSAFVQPGLMVVERSFGVLEFHSKTQADVQHAGLAALKCLGANLEDRVKPKIFSSEIIHKVNDYHTHGECVPPRLGADRGAGYVHHGSGSGWLYCAGRQ